MFKTQYVVSALIFKINGILCQKTMLSFGSIPSERVSYPKAAFNRGDPETILEKKCAMVSNSQWKAGVCLESNAWPRNRKPRQSLI